MAQRLFAVLFLAVATVLPCSADASCMVDSSSSFWPYDPAIPSNGILIGEADGALKDSMSRIAEQGPHLASAEEQVPLEVLKTFTFGYDNVQVVLKPARALKVGQRYELRLHRPLSDKQALSLTSWDRTLRKIVTRSWVASRAIDEASRWLGPPTSSGVETIAYGCGPAVHHRFAVRISESPGWLLVESETEKYPGHRNRALVRLEGRSVAIGHDMCGGPFRFEKGVRYRLRLSVLSAKGELVAAPGPALEIVGTE